jgi:hypothetical protein
MKKQFMLPAAAVLGGLAAFVLRLLQNRTGYEADTGLPIPGAPASIALAVWLVILAALFCGLVFQLPQESGPGPALPADFYTDDAKLLVLPVVGLLLMFAAGLADIYEGLGMGDLLSQLADAADPAAVSTSSGIFSGRLQMFLGVLSLLSAACLLPAAAACRRHSDDGQDRQERPLNGSTLLVPPICLVVRLVLTYRADSANPALGAYYVEILALVFLTLGFYRLASFTAQAGQTRRFALYASAAVTLCVTALADGGPHLSSLLLYAGGALTLLGFLLLRLAAPVYQAPPEPEDND